MKEKCPKCKRTTKGNLVTVCANCLADSGEEMRGEISYLRSALEAEKLETSRLRSIVIAREKGKLVKGHYAESMCGKILKRMEENPLEEYTAEEFSAFGKRVNIFGALFRLYKNGDIKKIQRGRYCAALGTEATP